LVSRLPLEELWSDTVDLAEARCLGAVERDELTQLLREGPVWFVVADCGISLVWVDLEECYAFWTREVKPHLTALEAAVCLESYPDEYAYRAQLWVAENLARPVIVLEKLH
jgi:hypothetical protein